MRRERINGSHKHKSVTPETEDKVVSETNEENSVVFTNESLMYMAVVGWLGASNLTFVLSAFLFLPRERQA